MTKATNSEQLLCARIADLEAQLEATRKEVAHAREAEEKCRQAERQLADRLEFEILLAELSAWFVSAPSEEIEAGLREAQRRVCACLGISGSSLWLAEGAPPRSLVLVNRHPGGETARGERLESFPWLLTELRLGRTVFVCSLDELPAQATAEAGWWREAAIETSFTIPLVAAGSAELLGALSFETAQARAWPEEVILRLQLVGGLFTSALQRKRALQDLQLSAAQFGMLFQANPLPLLYSRVSDGQVLDCNDAFLLAHGRSREQVQGKTVAELELWTWPDERAALVERVLRGDRSPSEVSLRAASGTPRDFLISGVALEMAGEPSLLTIAQDITDAKRAALDRDKLQEQLRHSQKMEAIGSLAGGVAHDFNNLLSVILSYTNFALSEVREGDPLREDLLEISKAGKRAVTLTRQLLAFGRKQVLQPRIVDLNQICFDLEKMLRRLIGEDIELRQELLPDLGAVQADPGQLEQVIMNLVVNSRDAMPRGGQLTIETSNLTLEQASPAGLPPGEYVQLSITDTGCGMDEATQQRAFEPFFTTKEKGKGTGLGLAMVYGIVNQSGGTVTLSSAPGRGTTFRVCLPRVAGVRPTPAPSLPSVRADLGHETVLLVEDEDGVRKAAARMLRSAGYRVLMAAHGGDALLSCERHAGEIHLMLTDVVMPQMDGRQLAQRLAKERPAMKVLYMSGYTDDALGHHGVLDAGTRFIVKPFDQPNLLRKVREALDAPSG